MPDGGPLSQNQTFGRYQWRLDHGSRHFTLATWHSAANYHSTFALLALADMSQPDSQRDETNAPVAEKRENGEVNSAARVRQILGPAIADRL
ncbi:MAG: hypothetical protein WB052_05915 [Pseudolabrys sp.]